jgi:hypothetical protein
MNYQFKWLALILFWSTLTFTAYGVDQEGTEKEPILPRVTTTAIIGNLTFATTIAGTSTKGGGNVTSQGASPVIERGLCWNTSGTPTIADSKVSDGDGAGIFANVTMAGRLVPDTIYFVRAYATNNEGTGYGNEILFNSGKIFGMDHAGGYVFFNDGKGGGLAASKSDQAASQIWIEGGAAFLTRNRNTSPEIGTGLANSYAIVSQDNHTGSAAQVCIDHNDGTYHDWFLPSKDELHLIYTRLKKIGVGGFADYVYWSSTEEYTITAWTQHFKDGAQHAYDKDLKYHVRAVRAF